MLDVASRWFCWVLLLATLPGGLSAQEKPSATALAAQRVVQIVAHRGASAERPENTLASTARAIEVGATAVEVDVRTTQDGHLVLLHDAKLSRTTNGEGLVGERTLSQIKKLDAGQKFNPTYADERVATLIEVLQLCHDKIDVLLDLKESGEAYDQRVAQTIIKFGQPSRTIVGVRSVQQAVAFRKLLPKSRQLGLIARPDDIEAYVAAGVETIRIWPAWLAKDATLGERVRKAGAKLHLNGTQGTEEEIVPLLAYQPDSLSSDDPRQLVATLAKLRDPASPP